MRISPDPKKFIDLNFCHLSDECSSLNKTCAVPAKAQRTVWKKVWKNDREEDYEMLYSC